MHSFDFTVCPAPVGDSLSVSDSMDKNADLTAWLEAQK